MPFFNHHMLNRSDSKLQSSANFELYRLRSDLKPGDVEKIAQLHGDLYEAEYGWNNAEFAEYVRTPLSKFAANVGPRERIWILEREHEIVGCIAMVEVSQGQAQLRWFLLHPSLRGLGLGQKLIAEALDFVQEQGYTHVLLWTVKGLESAARLYFSTGFELTEENPTEAWGKSLVEQRYDLDLTTRLRIGTPNETHIEALMDLLEDAVEDGASVGFLLPFDRELGRNYWVDRLTALEQYVVLAAWRGQNLVGSAQLAFPAQENGRCRAEVQRLLVLRSARRQGVGSALIDRLEQIAKAGGRRTLFLNTRTGDPPEAMYASLGYTAVGVIPAFAMNPDGTLNDTTFMYKRLQS